MTRGQVAASHRGIFVMVHDKITENINKDTA